MLQQSIELESTGLCRMKQILGKYTMLESTGRCVIDLDVFLLNRRRSGEVSE